jgi:hypothetical protein
LGSNPPPFVVHSVHRTHSRACHAPAAAENVLEEDEEQSYDEFVDMGQREPDEEGRGRWKLSSSRRTLALVPVRQQHKSAQWTGAGDVAVWLRAFLGVEVAILSELTIAHSSSGRKKKGLKKAESYVLEDRQKGVWFPLRTVHAVNGDGERMEAVDVFSLLKVAQEYVGSDHFSALFLVDVPLAEEVDQDVCHEVVRTRSDVSLPVDTGRRGYMDCVPIKIGCCCLPPFYYLSCLLCSINLLSEHSLEVFVSFHSQRLDASTPPSSSVLPVHAHMCDATHPLFFSSSFFHPYPVLASLPATSAFPSSPVPISNAHLQVCGRETGDRVCYVDGRGGLREVREDACGTD